METAWENLLKVKEELDELQRPEGCYLNSTELKESAVVYERKGEYLKAALTYFKGGFILDSNKMFDRAMKSMIDEGDYSTPAVVLWKIFKSPIDSINLLIKNKLYKPALEIAEKENLNFCVRQIESYLNKK